MAIQLALRLGFHPRNGILLVFCGGFANNPHLTSTDPIPETGIP